MPFEGVGPFWPTPTAGVGAPNHKIASAAPGFAGDGSVRWVQGAATAYRLFKPGATLVTTDPGAGPNDFGWNVLATDMDASANLPAKRRIPAGTWAFLVTVNGSIASLDNVWIVRVRIHKRSAGGVLTQQASGTSATFALALGAQEKTVNVTGVPEIVLNTGETIQIEYNLQGKGAALGNIDVEFFRGTGALGEDQNITLPGAGLRYLYPRSHAVAATLAVARGLNVKPLAKSVALALAVARSKLVKLNAKTVALSLAAAMTRRVTAARAFAVALSLATAIQRRVGLNAKSVTLALATIVQKRVILTAKTAALALDVVFARAITAARAFTAALSLAVTAQKTVILNVKTVVLSLATAIQRKVILNAKAVALSLNVAFARQVVAARSFAAALSLAAAMTKTIALSRSVALSLGTAFARVLTAARSFSAALPLEVGGFVEISFAILNRMVAGGTTIIKKLLTIFDD